MCVYYITWLVKTQKSKTKCSFIEILIVVLKLTIVIWDRNGPIINLDASVRSASLIVLFHQRFLSLENVYFLILLPFFFQKVGGPGPPTPPPAQALAVCTDKARTEEVESFNLFQRLLICIMSWMLFFSRLCKTSSFKLTQKCKPRATIYFQKCKVHVSIIEDSSEEVLAVYFLWDKRL